MAAIAALQDAMPAAAQRAPQQQQQSRVPQQQVRPGGGGAQGQEAGAPAPAHLPSMIRRGSEGAEVRMLQMLLEKTGLSPGPIDGIFGPATHGAVVQFQVRRGLEADGIVGPKTWTALRDKTGSDLDPSRYGAPQRRRPAAPPAGGGGAGGEQNQRRPSTNPRDEAAMREEILRVAGSQVGTLERGNNRGGATKYQQAFGRGPEPWCADFVSWVYSQAGKPTNSPYCPTFVQQLKRQGRWKGHSDPQPGDIVFFDWDGDRSPDHVGIVKSVNGGSITTIEGNTVNPNNQNQEGVFQKSRDYDAQGHRGRNGNTKYNDLILGFGSVA